MRMSPLILAAACALAMGLSAGPAAATTAIDGGVFQAPTSRVDASGPFQTVRQDAWTGTPRDLSANAGSQAFSGADTVLSAASIEAHWSSANSGRVNVTDHGWTFFTTDPDVHLLSSVLSTAPDGAPDWTYAFTASADGAFDLDFDLLATGDAGGIGAWDLLFATDGGPAQTTDLIDGLTAGVHGTGGFSHALLAGHDYRVSLRNREALVIGEITDTVPLREVVETGVFNWSISGAPEPSAWALSILGLGLAGAALRRRAYRTL